MQKFMFIYFYICSLNLSSKLQLAPNADESRLWIMGAHICDDGDAQVSHVGDDLTVLWGDLSVLDQLVQVLLRDA